jgi:hypothetical protein
VGAVAIAGLATSGRAHAAKASSRVRYIHAEIGPGPWSRAELARKADGIARDAGLGEPQLITALGADTRADTFPEEFALTLQYARNARIVMRASRTHRGACDIVIR